MSLIQDIKAAVPISELAARYGEVRRRGRLHVCRCLCGENSDRNPSFTLYDDDNHFHCFACGRHGSAIDLVMLAEGLDLRAAIERLRRQYLLGQDRDLAPRRAAAPAPRARTVTSDDALAVLEAATAHYADALARAPAARRYLHGRGLTDATIARLRIGYADGALGRALFARGQDLARAAEVGLLTPRGEFLRGRIVFPVLDALGRPAWMIGRALDDAQPKYLGLPDGAAHKQPMVLGTPRLGSIWAEGPFDVAALVQWGLEADYLLVGLLGTAHADALAIVRDRAPGCRVFAATDQDAAGERAAEAILRDLAAVGIGGVRVRWAGAKDCGGLGERGSAGREQFLTDINSSAHVRGWTQS